MSVCRYKGGESRATCPRLAWVRHWAGEEDDITFYQTMQGFSLLQRKYVQLLFARQTCIQQREGVEECSNSQHQDGLLSSVNTAVQSLSVGIDWDHFYSLRSGCRGQTSSKVHCGGAHGSGLWVLSGLRLHLTEHKNSIILNCLSSPSTMSGAVEKL